MPNYLENFAMSTTSNKSIVAVTFSIPSNCNYNLTGSVGNYCIVIRLNTNESAPSMVMLPQSVNLTTTSAGALTFDFDQPGITPKRPKTIVDI